MSLPSPEQLTLRDGTLTTIRPIRPDDAPRLQALVLRLSPESLFLRFLAIVKSISDKEAARLATVDYQTCMAFVATADAGDDEQIIGVARYALVPDLFDDHGRADPAAGMAEAAVVVEDSYQRHGLGSVLLNRLTAYARRHGVRSFLANIHPSNEAIMRFIRRSGLPLESRVESGVWQIVIHLDRDVSL